MPVIDHNATGGLSQEPCRSVSNRTLCKVGDTRPTPDQSNHSPLMCCDGRGITKTSVTPYVIWRSQTGGNHA
jgi:hypothetical protein